MYLFLQRCLAFLALWFILWWKRHYCSRFQRKRDSWTRNSPTSKEYLYVCTARDRFTQFLNPFCAADGTCEENKQFDDYRLLVSLFTLNEQLSRHNPTKSDIEKLFKWCSVYSIPCENTVHLKHQTIWDQYHRIGFYYYDFRFELFSIFQAYKLWLRVFRDSALHFGDLSKEDCIAKLELTFSQYDFRQHTNCSQIPFSYRIKVQDLLTIGYAQLFSLYMDTENTGIDICTFCTKPYIKHDKRQIQCPECRKESYKRTRKAMKAGGITDGKEPRKHWGFYLSASGWTLDRGIFRI